MSTESRALAIVEAALDIADPQARARYVAEQCGDDAALAARVAHLLSLEDSDFTLSTDSVSRLLGLSDAISDVLPERIGPFRVVGEIARGGMGAVVRAERDDGMFQQTVAIKLIRGDIASDRAKARFAEERRILARLRHPAIVRILDGGEHAARPWLAMDFIDGLPITAALETREADGALRLNAFETVCEAVAYAHRMLVIHADIKPSNIMIAVDGSVHLLDFGIARMMVALSDVEAGESYPLTKSYAAPERVAGAPPTIVSDVFSLGMLLIELLSGQAPEPNATDRVGPAVASGHLPGDLGAIARRAVAENPGDRYPDVVSLLDDIRRYRTHRPVLARGEGDWRYRSRLFVLRHRKGLVLTGVIMAVLLATSIVSTLSYLRAEAARKEADARFDDARGVARYLIYTLIPKLEQVPRALPLRAEVAGVAEHYLRRLSTARQASDAVRMEAADGLLQLAQYQARAGRPNLAQPEKADTNLREAKAILRSLPGDRARLLLAQVQIERARLAVWMQADERRAETLLRTAEQSLAPLRARAPALAREHAMVLADLKGWQGRFAEEAVLADRALALLGADGSAYLALDRARMTGTKAEALYYLGKPAAALPLYGARLTAMEALHRRLPDDNFVLTRLVLAQWDYGTNLLGLRRFAEAVPVLDEARTRAQTALAFDPSDQETRRMVRVTRNAYAQAVGFVGRTDEALNLMEAVRRDDERTLAASPSPRRARDLVYDYTLIGETLDAAGRRAAACAADTVTLSLYRDLERRRLLMAIDSANNIKLARERAARNCP